jgi:hypothetical protein
VHRGVIRHRSSSNTHSLYSRNVKGRLRSLECYLKECKWCADRAGPDGIALSPYAVGGGAGGGPGSDDQEHFTVSGGVACSRQRVRRAPGRGPRRWAEEETEHCRTAMTM